MRFNDKQISYLKSHKTFKYADQSFFEYLKRFRFTGTVWAVPEGTVLFPNEPIIRIEAPIIEAQIVETYILSMINFQSLIASKASRIITSAKGKSIIEFGSRRAHGPQAAVLAGKGRLYWRLRWNFKCTCRIQARNTDRRNNGTFLHHEF